MCAAEAHCPLGPDPRRTYDDLATELEAHPLPAPGGGDNLPVTLGDLDTATLFYLSVPSFGAAFTTALVAAEAGNGAPLRSEALEFEVDLDGTSLVGSQWAYQCNDAVASISSSAAGRLARSLAARDGQVAAYAVTYDLAGCTDWPAPSAPIHSVAVVGAPHIVVIGNTGDPNTPHSVAVQLATPWPGRAGDLEGLGHTWLLNGISDPCMVQVVDAYLVSGTAPADGSTCG